MSDWISVKDRLPDLAVNVLLATRYGVTLGSAQRNLKGDGTLDMSYLYFWSAGPRYFTLDDVTHWMPLPELPAEGRAG